MQKKINNYLTSAFLLFYIFTYFIIFYNYFKNTTIIDSYSFLTVLSFILNFGLLFLINYIIQKNYSFFDKSYNKILLVFCVIYFIIIVIIGIQLRFTPAFDMSAIYNNAIELVEKSTIATIDYPTTSKDYFYYFPNNLGACYFLAIFFKFANILGITDYFLVGIIVNSALISLTIYFSSKILSIIFSTKEAILVLVFFIIMPAFLFGSATFYTDFLSIFFPIISFYIYLKFINAKNNKSKILLAVLFSILLSIGTLIKFTSIIIFIAIIIFSILNKSAKNTFIITTFGITFLIFITSTFSLITSTKLDEDLSYKYSTPYTHWIMMGLNGNGRYNPSDFDFTRSFSNIDERNDAINDEILRRIDDLGISGLLNLWENKMEVIFSDGTLGASDFLDDNPVNTSVFHNFILYQSPNFNIYKAWCDGAFLLIIFLGILKSLILLFTKDFDNPIIIALITATGAMLFFFMWETSNRYITNFVPILILSAVSVFNIKSNLIKKRPIK